jgi:hypothetical protein
MNDLIFCFEYTELLDFSDNELRGTIPTVLGRMGRLCELFRVTGKLLGLVVFFDSH